jgi:hypothetical protein
VSAQNRQDTGGAVLTVKLPAVDVMT